MVVGSVLHSGFRWGMLIALAKLAPAETVGRFVLAAAIVEPVLMFATLQLSAVQATDAKREFIFRDYLALRIITSVLGLIVIAGICLTVDYSNEQIIVILLFAAAKVTESISDIFYGLLQLHQRMDWIAKSMASKGFLALVFFTLAIYLGYGLPVAVSTIALASLLILIAYDLHNVGHALKTNHEAITANTAQATGFSVSLRPRWDMTALTNLFLLALPLGIVMMLVSLNVNIGRYFIERLLGEKALGIFAAMAYLIIAGFTIVNAMAQAAGPRLAQQYVGGKIREFRALLYRLLSIGILLGGTGIVVAWLAAAEILTFVYRSEYAAYADVLVLVMAWGALYYVAALLGCAMTATRRLNIQVVSLAFATLTTATASIALIPSYGIWGAAVATALGGLVQLILNSLVVAHILRS